MKARQIISMFLMIILTVLLTFLVTATSIYMEVNSNSILKTMIKTGYLEKAEGTAQEILDNYLPNEKTIIVLENISVKSQIKEIILSFDNNTIEEVANEKRMETKNEIINVLDKSIDNSIKESFAETVSLAYIKAIFPVTEFNVFSTINSRYSQSLILGLIVLGIISLGIYIFHASKSKTYKWSIIAIYNSIIFSFIIYIILGLLNNVTIGNVNTTEVIAKFIKNIQLNIIIGIVLLIILAIFSNWNAYFRKRKHRSK